MYDSGAASPARAAQPKSMTVQAFLRGKYDVVWFDVPMDVALGMEITQPRRDMRQHLHMIKAYHYRTRYLIPAKFTN